MAGGGLKGGLSYGVSDDYGYEGVENRVSIHDWHATILHLLGLDHERLTYRYAGRDFRLTDVYGNVNREIIAIEAITGSHRSRGRTFPVAAIRMQRS